MLIGGRGAAVVRVMRMGVATPISALVGAAVGLNPTDGVRVNGFAGLRRGGGAVHGLGVVSCSRLGVCLAEAPVSVSVVGVLRVG